MTVIRPFCVAIVLLFGQEGGGLAAPSFPPQALKVVVYYLIGPVAYPLREKGQTIDSADTQIE